MKNKKILLSLKLGLIASLLIPAFVLANEDVTVVPEINPSPTYSETPADELTCLPEEHVYWHENVSVDTNNFEHWASVFSFAIVLDTDHPGGTPAVDDFLSNVDTQTMMCTVDEDLNGDGSLTQDEKDLYVPCPFDPVTDLGTVLYSNDAWSGTSITYTTLDWIAGSPRGLLWEYGTDNPDDEGLKPWIASGGQIQEAIAFEAIDYTIPRSATTESWTKLQFWTNDLNTGDWYEDYTVQVDNFGSNLVDPDGDFIYWYGLNGRLRTIWDDCEDTPEPVCADLEIIPSSLDINDLFTNIDIEVIATDTDGDVMTNVEYHYTAAALGSPVGTADAAGIFKYGWLLLSGGTNDEQTLNTVVQYRNGLPGDSIYVEVVGAEGVCNAQLELPYCADLNILNPSDSAFVINGDVYNDTITIEAFDSNGDPWPFDFNYDSTDLNSLFDATNNPIYVTPNTSVTYSSEHTSFVTVTAENDVAGVCSDQFFYEVIPEEDDELFCDYLEILTPIDPVIAGEMESGITITWESFLDDGSVAPGPWNVISTNPNGEFFDSNTGASLGTGSVLSHTVTTIDYVGESGDQIFVYDALYGECEDFITSETIVELPYCVDLTLEDPEGLDDLETFFDQAVTCFDFSVDVSDPTFLSTLQASGFEDSTRGTLAPAASLELRVNETGTVNIGNPALLALDTGLTTYTGSVCWTGFEENNYLELSVLGSEDVCFGDFEFPELPVEEPVCEDLRMEVETDEFGTTDITVETQGSDSSWTGDLIIEDSTGTCELFYGDGSSSEFPDGHLQIPVSGISDNVRASAEGCETGDSIHAYVVGFEGVCEEEIPFEEEPFCVDLRMEPELVTIPAGDDHAGEIDIAIETQGSDASWTGTVIVEDSAGACELFYDDGSPSEFPDGHLEIPTSGISLNLRASAQNCESEDSIRAYVEDFEAVCEAVLELEQEEPVCEELFFDPDDVTVIETEDKEVMLHLESELDDQTLVIEYNNCPDSGIEVNGASYDERAELVLDGDQWLDLTFNNLCEDAEISAYVEGFEDVCSDEIALEFVELGEFSKYIFTFNFAVEKDNFSDDGIFFSHDEDRSFYTLEYDPTGDEGSITFTDDMWDGDLDGHLGSGEDSGGSVDLATSYDDLTRSDVDPSNVYEYNTITHFGFGEQHELNSTDIYNYVDANYTSSDWETFVAYIKYDDNRESVIIPECDDEIGSDICYDQDTRPEDTGSLTIHNAGEVDEDATIRIRYVGIVVSGLDCGSTTDECLTEEFQNNAEVKVYSGIDSLQADAKLVVLCSYLVTRNAGDVYLEVALEGGSDVACIFVEEDEATSAEYRNVDALIILEADPDAYTPSLDFTPVGEAADLDGGADLDTGYSGATISLCDDDEYEDNLIGNLSSYVCEIVSSVTDLWQSAIVESTTETQVSQATRNAETNQSISVFKDWTVLESQLSNINNPESGILYFDGANEDSITLGALTVPEGAWTIIVENADLILDSNIKYADSTNFANLPSVAFIVLGGDIHIDNDALNLVGVYYTDQSITGDERSAVNEPLEIHGSIYGHVQPLLDAAKYVGSPRLDEGGVQVYYDERIILNTPPALSEYVDISTEEAVN